MTAHSNHLFLPKWSCRDCYPIFLRQTTICHPTLMCSRGQESNPIARQRDKDTKLTLAQAVTYLICMLRCVQYTRIQNIRAFYQNTFLKMTILRRTLSNLFKLNLNSIHLDFPRDLFNFIYDFLFCWTHFRKLNLVMHLEIQLDCKLGPT